MTLVLVQLVVFFGSSIMIWYFSSLIAPHRSNIIGLFPLNELLMDNRLDLSWLSSVLSNFWFVAEGILKRARRPQDDLDTNKIDELLLKNRTSFFDWKSGNIAKLRNENMRGDCYKSRGVMLSLFRLATGSLLSCWSKATKQFPKQRLPRRTDLRSVWVLSKSASSSWNEETQNVENYFFLRRKHAQTQKKQLNMLIPLKKSSLGPKR